METEKEYAERLFGLTEIKRPENWTIGDTYACKDPNCLHCAYDEDEIIEDYNFLDGFIIQFKEELSNEDWTVSRWLAWLKLNNFKIVK